MVTPTEPEVPNRSDPPEPPRPDVDPEAPGAALVDPTIEDPAEPNEPG